MEEGKLKDQTSIDVLKILSDYRELKDRLGCDPIKVIKALTEGCWMKKGYFGTPTCLVNSEPIFINLPAILMMEYSEKEGRKAPLRFTSNEKELCLCYSEFGIPYGVARIRDYGKTWALTKEELL